MNLVTVLGWLIFSWILRKHTSWSLIFPLFSYCVYIFLSFLINKLISLDVDKMQIGTKYKFPWDVSRNETGGGYQIIAFLDARGHYRNKIRRQKMSETIVKVNKICWHSILTEKATLMCYQAINGSTRE